MGISWLTELQKHCQCEEVILPFSLPKQVRDSLHYLDIMGASVSSELLPRGAGKLSGLGEW
jgi:hypothetical protein